mmetsp:Transcript_38475/g.49672  ORF Transcript_38475/g.49672 Transcript_38475/m.49672 type:complete len:678 (+) Transcript_38475:70-2103(+)
MAVETSKSNNVQLHCPKPSFSVVEMIEFLDGSKDVTTLKKKIMNELEEDPLFDDFIQQKRVLGKNEIRHLTFLRVKKLQEGLLADGKNEHAKAIRRRYYGLADFDMEIRYLVHRTLFGGAVFGQGTDEQRQKWMPLIESMAIYGCFGMTEIGHGSFLRGLETTATYDQSSDEFVITSPTVTSTKWWIGGAAETATHSTVFAKLYVNGKDYGVHTFIVPLRDMSSLQVLPGIRIGDCGMKMGGNGIDNGWLQFQNVRIPRENLLSRFASLSADGIYTPPPSPQIVYGALVGGRVGVFALGVVSYQKALTIAIRYSNKRKQGVIDCTQGEVSLMNYSYHQHRLLTHLSLAYAWTLFLPKLEALTQQMIQGFESGDFSLLPEVHALAAGAKAFGTWDAFAGINECRQACGGHGYSELNGLAPLQRDFAVMGTWEGDNSVMAQQTARYLVGTLRSIWNKKPISAESTIYLKKPFSSMQTVASHEDLQDPVFLESLLAALCQFKVSNLVSQQDEAKRSGVSAEEIGNWQQAEFISCARSHMRFCMIKSFRESLERSSIKLKVVLHDVLSLAALTMLKEDFSLLIESNILSKCSIHLLRQQIQSLCFKLATDSVALVDAFNLCDRLLGSCIGSASNKDIYKSYLCQAETLHGHNLVPTYHTEVLALLNNGQNIVKNQKQQSRL